MQIKVVIMNHNKPESSDRLYKELSLSFSVSLFDSGSDEDKMAKNTTHSYENLYWTGCWNKAMELFDEYDVLWVIGGDISIGERAHSYRHAIETAMPFGCWSPMIHGNCRPFMDRSNSDKESLFHVYHIEGVCMAVSRNFLKKIPSLPEGNHLGWGQDVWMCYRSWTEGMKNILDGRVWIAHPAERGYNANQAYDIMERWFIDLEGENWRTTVRHWYEDFENNTIKGFKPKTPVVDLSVIVSTYNSMSTVGLSLESFANQEFLPKEVVVADDGSSDGTIEWLDSIIDHRYPFALKYVTRKHNGYRLVSANNEAVKHTTGRRILFTNADQIHNPRSVKSHADIDDLKIGGGVFTGINEEGVPLVSIDTIRNFSEIENLSVKFPPSMTNIKHMTKPPNINLHGCWGGNYSISRKIFDSVNGFDESYEGKYGGEEADMLVRTAFNNCRLSWVNSSISYHLEHPIREYKKKALGNTKFKKDYGIE